MVTVVHTASWWKHLNNIKSLTWKEEEIIGMQSASDVFNIHIIILLYLLTYYLCLIAQHRGRADTWQLTSVFLCSPYAVGRRWWDVDDQSPWQLLYLHGEQQGRVWHLLKLLPNELVLRCLLEILGFGNFVHKSQNLLSGFSTPCPVRED